MENNFKNLVEALTSNNTTLLTRTLNIIVKNEQCLELPETAISTFADILTRSDEEIQRLCAQAIGELAKTESNRQKLSKNEIVGPLVLYSSSSNLEIQRQTCRAIGNICYENDMVRPLFGKASVENIVRIVKSTRNTNIAQSDNNLILVSCGCLMNLINGNEELQEATLQCDILDTLESILRSQIAHFEQNEACISHLLIILNMIIEYMTDDWLSKDLNYLLVDILRVSVNPEISGLCLEILQAQSENDDVKLYLARYGTCQLIHELVETHKHRIYSQSDATGDDRSMLKLACDLIILILNGDAAMELLYSNGNGEVYKHMLGWLDANDSDIVSAGVVAIGNFARDDAKCIKMVESGLGTKLLNKLSSCTQESSDTKIIFALLSALRNLSIPAVNKTKLLQQNLVEILLSLVNIEIMDPVVFKLLGTLRMVVDGQEKTAMFLLNRREFVSKLVHWCRNSEHLGVRGEAPRLLAWLIKNQRSSIQHTSLLASVPEVVHCLVDMLGSMHPVMQNEAILALVLLSANVIQTSVVENLLNQTDEEKIQAKSSENNKKMENMSINNTGNSSRLDEADASAEIPIISESSHTPTSISSIEQLFLASGIATSIQQLLQRDAGCLETPALGNLLSLLEQLSRSRLIRRSLAEQQIDTSLAALLPKLSTYESRINSIVECIRRSQ